MPGMYPQQQDEMQEEEDDFSQDQEDFTSHN
jgi:hypothetical protein